MENSRTKKKKSLSGAAESKVTLLIGGEKNNKKIKKTSSRLTESRPLKMQQSPSEIKLPRADSKASHIRHRGPRGLQNKQIRCGVYSRGGRRRGVKIFGG